MSQLMSNNVIVGEPEVLEDTAAWISIKDAAQAIRPLQVQDGSIPDTKSHAAAREFVAIIADGLEEFSALLPHDADYLTAAADDFRRWATTGFAAPDFLD